MGQSADRMTCQIGYVMGGDGIAWDGITNDTFTRIETVGAVLCLRHYFKARSQYDVSADVPHRSLTKHCILALLLRCY